MNPHILIKIGGSLLREQHFKDFNDTLDVILGIGASGLVMTNGSMDLPTVVDGRLAHLASGSAKSKARPLVRDIVSVYFSELRPELAIARDRRDIEMLWDRGLKPILLQSEMSRFLNCDYLNEDFNSDSFAYLAAQSLGVDATLILTDVDGVYLPSGAEFPRKLLTGTELSRMSSSCVDRSVGGLINRFFQPVYVLNGLRPEVVQSFLAGARSMAAGTIVIPGGESPGDWLRLVFGFLGGKSEEMPSELMAARQQSTIARTSSNSDWSRESRIESPGPPNRSAYMIALALERIGVALATGVVPVPFFLSLCADQVCDDWMSCKSWIESYRSNDGTFSGPFRRRYAEFAFLVCATYLSQSYFSLLGDLQLPPTEELKERLGAQAALIGGDLASEPKSFVEDLYR